MYQKHVHSLKGWDKAVVFVVLLFFVSLVAGCVTPENPTAPEQINNTNNSNTPVLKFQSVAVPDNMKKSTDPNVQRVVGYLTQANTLADLNQYLNPPADAKVIKKSSSTLVADTTTYSWDAGSLNIKLLVIVDGAMTTYEIFFNGTSGSYTYTNFKYFHVHTTTDGSSYRVTVYDWNSTSVAIDYQYTYAAGITTIIVETATTRVTVDFDASYNGHVLYEMYSGGWIKQYESHWYVTGHGDWTIYDSSGNPSQTGSW